MLPFWVLDLVIKGGGMRYFVYFLYFFVFSELSFAGHATGLRTYAAATAHCAADKVPREASPNAVNRSYACEDDGPGLVRLFWYSDSGSRFVAGSYGYIPDCNDGDMVNVSGEGSLPGGLCQQGCAYNFVGVGASLGGFFAGGFEATGNVCEAGSVSENGPGANCITGDSGVEVCYDSAEPNCGTINGDSVCADDVPADNCIEGAGGRLCGQSAPTPPVPDNGTSGQPADPSDRITLGGTAPEIDYYDGDTVDNSSTSGTETVGGGGEAGSGGIGGDAGGDAGGDSGGDTGGDGDGDGEGGDECDPNITLCTGGPGGDLYDPTDLTYDSVFSGFTERISSAPFYSAAGGFFEVEFSGSCPIWEIPAVMAFPSIPIDMQCSAVMTNYVFPLVSGVLLITAGFLAFRWAFL